VFWELLVPRRVGTNGQLGLRRQQGMGVGGEGRREVSGCKVKYENMACGAMFSGASTLHCGRVRLESARMTSTDAGATVGGMQEEEEQRVVTLQVRGNGCMGILV
jgi:hypothetical protein